MLITSTFCFFSLLAYTSCQDEFTLLEKNNNLMSRFTNM